MYNYQKLLGKMRECQITQEKMAELLCVSPASLNKKLNNRAQFRQNEMKAMLNILGVDLKNIATYFFSQ